MESDSSALAHDELAAAEELAVDLDQPEEDTESDSDSGSYMSSSFYASDQGEDSEDESYNTTASTVLAPVPPAQPATVVQPANTLPGLPFLPLQEISSYLSLEDLSALYHTHRQLRATIDDGSLAFFGRFWAQPPKSEWVNKARRNYGWYDKHAHPGEVDATTKLGDVGMDEFWKQVKSAFWVSSLAGDRNDRAMIQQSFWSSLLSPENSPPPEPAPTSFASQSSRAGSPAGPLPKSQTRILRPTLSAGYRAYAQHGYVLTGAHHLLLLQHEACWPCLFAPEEGSQGPEIKIIHTSRPRSKAGLKRRFSYSSSSSASEGDSIPWWELKVCDGCGGASCGRHPTSAETARSLGLEISYLPPPSPAQVHFLLGTTSSSREAITSASQGTNPLQIYFRRRNPQEDNNEPILAHFTAAAGVGAGWSSSFGSGGGGGANSWILPPWAGPGGGGGPAGGGGAVGGGNGPGPGGVPHPFGGGFAAFVAGLQGAGGPPPHPAPAPAPAHAHAHAHANHWMAPHPIAPAGGVGGFGFVAPPAALAPAPTHPAGFNTLGNNGVGIPPLLGHGHGHGLGPGHVHFVQGGNQVLALPANPPAPAPAQPAAHAALQALPPLLPSPTTTRYHDWWVCASCADAFGPGAAWSRRGDWD